MINKQDILELAAWYANRYPAERNLIEAMEDFIERGKDPISRKTFEGHITCGAVVLNEQNRVLQIHHRALDMWLLPGGHVENSDQSLQAAAKREVQEETGIPQETLEAVSIDNVYGPVDIDYHAIPPNREKQEPGHSHWDFRFVFRVKDPKVAKQLEEINDASWVPVEAFSKKLAEKLRQIR